MLDKLQKGICRTIGPSLAAFLEPMVHCQNVSSLSLFWRYYLGKCKSELAQLVPLSYSCWRQGLIQAILMAGRQHKKLNFLTEDSTSIWDFKTMLKVNQLTRFLLFQAIHLSSRNKKAKTLSWALPPEPSPGLCHEPIVELAAPQDLNTCILK